MGLRELLGLSSEEAEEVEIEEPEEVEETVETPSPQYATMEQTQQMIDAVTNKLQENFASLFKPQSNQQDQIQLIQPPSLDQIAEAFDNGETKKAVELQALREAALEQRHQIQMYQLRNEGRTIASDINSRLIDTAVPDHKKYKKEVDKMMDELGLPGEYRDNIKIRSILTNSIKGEKFDDLYNERIEAERRQANSAGTGEPSGTRTAVLNAPPREVVSEEAKRALRMKGIDQEQFAKSHGYQSWSDYESNAAAYQAHLNGESKYVPKWRRNK